MSRFCHACGAQMRPDAACPGAFYVTTDANRRSRATATSSLAGRISRGATLRGTVIIGEDGESNWLRLADGSGYVSSVNVSQTPPQQLATMLGERRFRPANDLQFHALPSKQSATVDTVPVGTALILNGITANGYAESRGRFGGVGYFRAAGYDFSR